MTRQIHRADVSVKQGTESSINEYQVLPDEKQLNIKGRAQLLLAQSPHEEEGIVLIKRFNKKRDDKAESGYFISEDIVKELDMAAKMDHVNLVKTFEIINDPVWFNIFMIMEYVDGGEILSFDQKRKMFLNNKYGNNIPENLIKKAMLEILTGLNYMHTNNIVHRDIKPANILVTKDWDIRIADFGISEEVAIEAGKAMVNSQRDGGIIGTLLFLPPESFTSGSYCGIRGDIWATGLTLFAMISAKLPIMELNEKVFIEKITKMKTIPYPSTIRGWASNRPLIRQLRKNLGFKGENNSFSFLKRMLEIDGDKRETTADLLEDPYLAEAKK